MQQETDSTPRVSGFGRWIALTAALLGWLFDGAEMGLFSLVGRDAIRDLVGGDDSQIGPIFGIIIAVFLAGAATGGVLFGWLGDRIGRVRAMALSILTYSLFTGLCGFAQSTVQLAFLRFVASLGMGGEWALGVALVMEIWPNRSRFLMAGLIGAAANVGYVLVALLGLGLASVLESIHIALPKFGLADSTTEMLVAHRGWRIMMMLGALPALLTFIIRLYVPESERWNEQSRHGATQFWKTSDLLGVLVGAAGVLAVIFVWTDQFLPAQTVLRVLGRTILTVVGMAVAFAGYIYPVHRYLVRSEEASQGRLAFHRRQVLKRMMLGAAISGVPLLGTWGSTQWIPTWTGEIVAKGRVAEDWMRYQDRAKELAQISAASGAVAGTLAIAFVGAFVARRITYASLCIASFASVLWLFLREPNFDGNFLLGSFIVGACTASFYGWLPLYLPELFQTRYRATGQGFAFNFGRILAAIGALQAGVLTQFPRLEVGNWVLQGGFPLACSSISLIYFVGLGLIWLLPETFGKPLPE